MQILLMVHRMLNKTARRLNNALTRRFEMVFIASFLRFLHCGRYPWVWNDEHVLVLPAVV